MGAHVDGGRPGPRAPEAVRCAPAGEIAAAVAALAVGGWVELCGICAPDAAGDRKVRSERYPADPAGFALLAERARALARVAEGVYITVNPLRPGRGRRAKDSDVIRRAWIFVDVDPTRPADVSATDREKAHALEVTEAVRADLDAHGWPAPIEADSGNGFHLHYRADLATNDEGLVARFLRSLSARHSTPGATVDVTVGNPARLCKLYGTPARKGPDTPDRPHRLSGLIAVPEPIVAVLPRRIQDYCAAYPPPDEVPGPGSPAGPPAPRPAPPRGEGPVAAYCARAIGEEVARVREAPQHHRNKQLFKSARSALEVAMAAPGQADPAVVEAELRAAAIANGLPAPEVERTLQSARKGAVPRDLSHVGTAPPAPAPVPAPPEAPRPPLEAPAAPVGQEPEWIVSNRSWVPCVANIVMWLEWMGRAGDFATDTFLGILTVGGREINERDPVELARRIERDRGVMVPTGKVREAILCLAGARAVDALRDYFDGLAWDGTPRVDDYFERAFDAYAAMYRYDPTGYRNRQESRLRSYLQFVSRSFLIGLAARALDPGCQVDTMPVLIGDQGLNKSASFRELCPRPEWFTDDIGDIHTKDACQTLKGIFIVEFAEFNRLMRASPAAAKSFLTKRDDRYRAAYAHYTVRHPRRCIFVGTTNEDMPLTDIENRRFYPVRVALADLDYIRAHRDQILAEAAHRFRAGEAWWSQDDEITEVVRERQDLARKPDAWAEALAERLTDLPSTFTQADAFRLLGVPAKDWTRGAASDLGNALAKAGCPPLPRRIINGSRVTQYQNPTKTTQTPEF